MAPDRRAAPGGPREPGQSRRGYRGSGSHGPRRPGVRDIGKAPAPRQSRDPGPGEPSACSDCAIATRRGHESGIQGHSPACRQCHHERRALSAAGMERSSRGARAVCRHRWTRTSVLLPSVRRGGPSRDLGRRPHVRRPRRSSGLRVRTGDRPRTQLGDIDGQWTPGSPSLGVGRDPALGQPPIGATGRRAASS
jgi:hypothetical protein